MKTPKKIRRFWLLVGIILLVELAAITLWKRWYWFFPTGQVSEVYTKYAGTDGINVAFFKDYRINDTVFVDVTILEANDSASWVSLKNDFEVPNPSPDFQQFIDNGEDLIYVKVIPKSTTTDTILDSYSNNLLAISHLNRTLTVFHVKNKTELHVVMHYNFDKSTNQ
jgi:hypothetical protein